MKKIKCDIDFIYSIVISERFIGLTLKDTKVNNEILSKLIHSHYKNTNSMDKRKVEIFIKG